MGCTFNVYYTDWKCKSVRVTDESKRTVLYEADIHYSTPHITYRKSPATNNTTICTAKFNYTATQISLTFSTTPQDLLMKAKNWKLLEFPYQSAAFGGRELTWSGGLTCKIVCTDENKMPVARCTMSKMAMKKIGTLEFMDGVADLGEQVVDEIVVTGLTIMLKCAIPALDRAAANGAAASSASSAAAAAAAAASG